MSSMYIDFSVAKNCINFDNYSCICVHCNMCGRFDKSTMWECRYKYYLEQQKECIEKMTDKNFQTDLQQTNIAKDMCYFGKKLQECIKHIKFPTLAEAIEAEKVLNERQGEQ